MKSEDRETVWKNEMTGYREPMKWEKECIRGYVYKKVKYGRAVVSGWNVFAMVCAVAMVGGTIQSITEQQMATALFNGVWSVLMLWIIYNLCKGIKNKNMLIQAVKSEKFTVMDCLAYHVDIKNSATGEGDVWIYNAAGQKCGNKLSVDIQSVREWQNGSQQPFLLVRCDYGGAEPYFELFSERKLKSGERNG